MTSGEPVQLSYSPSGGGRALRIIVVDDERDTVLTLMTILRHEGHEVWGLYRANDVLAGIKHFDPDAVLLDIGLPDGSGYAIAEQVRRNHGRGRPMLIAVTGLYTETPNRSLSEAVGFDHFVTKSFEADLVLRLIEPLRSAPRLAQDVPSDMSMSTTATMRSIEVAEKYLGTDELAFRIGAPVSTVRAWRMGHAAIPDAKFRKLVEIVASLEPNWDKGPPG